MTTNVPPVQFTAVGPVAPTEAVILAGVEQDIQAAFGGGLNFDNLETPQGQLASSMAAIIGNADDSFVSLVNNMDPAYAQGRYQDAIGRIYFLERIPSSPTAVEVLCTGLAGTVIPLGAQAQAADNNIYLCTGAGTIPVGGTITLQFACSVDGPITCPANSLTRIYQAIPGWDSVNNLADGVVGNNTESRYAFEARRAASVALNSIGSLPSVLGAVLSVPNVLDAYVTENVSNSPVTIGGATLVAHSLYVAAVGGDALAIATAIWSKKAPGCNYNGNTTETVYDTNSGYSPPYPSYSVTFEIPPALPIIFAVALANNAQVPANAATLVQNAIIAAFAGNDGGARARIGSTIYALRYTAPIQALGAWVQIVSLNVGSANVTDAAFTASISGTNMTVTAVGSGTLAVGQTVEDAVGGVVLPGTTIVSQSSGSAGSTGVYVVTLSQTVTSRAMVGVVPDDASVAVQINQSPTINAANIAVTLV